MTDKELTARIAELNAQRAALKKERDKLVWEEGIPAIIAKMKRLGGDTICLRGADDATNCFHVDGIWGSFEGGYFAANRLKLDENDNLVMVYNDLTNNQYSYCSNWEYGSVDRESVVTEEISNAIIAPNLDVILNDITDYYQLHRLPQKTLEMVDMHEMFKGREDLRSLDLSHFDTSKVTNMRMMFKECYNLKSIDLSSFDTSNVTDMSEMFAHCSSLKSPT